MKTINNLLHVWRSSLLVFLLILGIYPVLATNISVSGTISTNTTWSADTIKVTGDISIPTGVTLTINPGCKVLFQGYYKISILGNIVAIGQPAKLIIFTVKDTTGLANMASTQGGWHGLRFPSQSTSTASSISFCIFEYGKASDAGTDGCGGAIYAESHPFGFLDISSSTFRYCYANKGGAVFANNCSFPFRSNLVYSSVATEGGAMYLQSSPSYIFNVTFTKNKANSGGAIYCLSSSPYLVNSILYKNYASYGSHIFLNDNASDPYISYCDLEGGKLLLGGTGASSYTGVFEGCVDADPLFFDEATNKYLTVRNSICINNGNPDLGPTHFTLSTYDLVGNSRINENRADIGAFESYPLTRLKGIKDTAMVANYQSLTLDMNSYFKGNGINTTLSYSLPLKPDTNTVSVAINNNLVKITPKTNKTGVDTLIIIATSFYGESLSDTFLVKVDYCKIKSMSPINNYKFSLRSTYEFSWGPLYPVYSGQIKYILRMVEIQQGQSPEQAIINNASWYADTSALMSGTATRNITITKTPTTYQNIAWQVKAIDQAGVELTKSAVCKFFGPPLLEAFYAENTVVTVDTTTVNDLSNLSGSGRFTVPYLGNVKVSFSHLNIGYSGYLITLKSGAINYPYPKVIDISPEYAGNGNAQFYLDTLYLGTNGIYFKGVAKWKPTFCDTTTLVSKYANLQCSGYLIGVVNLKNQKKYVDAIPGSFIEIDSTSTFIARGNKYALGLTGKITKSIVSGDFEDNSISLPFANLSKVDYNSIVLPSNQIAFKVSKQISVIPESYYLDFSNTTSPALLTSNPVWKGIWINKFKFIVESPMDDYNFVTPGNSWISINLETNKKNLFTVDLNETAFNLDTTFISNPLLKLNGFNGSLMSLHITHPYEGLSKDTIKGSVVIPYINETANNNYSFTAKGADKFISMVQILDNFTFSSIKEKAITSFSVLNGNDRIPATINEGDKTISFAIPPSVDSKKIIAYFITTGIKVTVNGTNQVRGITQNDFTNPITYTVLAGDGSTVTYKVSASKMTGVIGSSERKIKLKYYPNPVQDNLFIDNPFGEIQATIYSLEGSIIKTINLESDTKVIDVSNLPKGIYIIRLQNSTIKTEAKFIKM